MVSPKKGDVYIERRQKEKDFAIRRKGSQRASAVAPTQAQAIKIAQKMFPGIKPDVSRVRYTKSGKPDKWRNKYK